MTLCKDENCTQKVEIIKKLSNLSCLDMWMVETDSRSYINFNAASSFFLELNFHMLQCYMKRKPTIYNNAFCLFYFSDDL